MTVSPAGSQEPASDTVNRNEANPANTMHTYKISPESEPKIIDWLLNRNGVAVWQNLDLGSPNIGQESFTPAQTETGLPYPSPNWRNGNSPAEVVTDPAAFVVQTWREVSRVKIRSGPPYLGCVNRADRPKLDKALEAAGEGATYRRDYSNMQYGSAWFEAVIEVPDETRPLAMPIPV